VILKILIAFSMVSALASAAFAEGPFSAWREIPFLRSADLAKHFEHWSLRESSSHVNSLDQTILVTYWQHNETRLYSRCFDVLGLPESDLGRCEQAGTN